MKTFRKFSFISIITISMFFSLGLLAPETEEGMYPLSEIHNVDLVRAGLKISPKDIYDPNGISLVDALVNVGGCTGSFVSPDGLIITNHHCAFGAINRASSTDNNYLEDGFLAETRSQEISATGYKCKITESYEDVSKIILDAVKGIDDLAERTKAISKKINELNDKYTDLDNSIEARVSEMFAGQTYVLFKYRIIEDVRLVYAPPRAIGEFGGESDNWVWPRHTGDFTFMRAYVAPDGSSAKYSKENVPFKPKKFLKVNPNGVEENDFVFVLGYPGRTFRHQPSQYLEYQQEYLLPYVSELYEWTIKLIEDISSGDEAMQLKYASTIKGYANTMKNYQGKLKGLRKIQLIQKKRDEEQLLKDFIKAKPELKNKYGKLFVDIDNVYSELFDIAEADLWFQRFPRVSNLMNISSFIIENAKEKEKPNLERKSMYMESNLDATKQRIERTFDFLNSEIELNVWAKMFDDAYGFENTSRIRTIDSLIKNEDDDPYVDVEAMLNSTNLYDKSFFNELTAKPYKELKKVDDDLFQLIISLYEEELTINKKRDAIEGALGKLLPQLAEVKRMWNQKSFIPDANGTLRLTYGYVKGYAPADAVYYTPITTLDGVIEKSYMGGDYSLPDKMYDLYEAKDFGKFYNKKIGGVPVALLYNMDTTGGNSGSPILNAYGEIVGVNFDRAYEATINDFAWNESYSRSIGVDIRYILWITQKYGGADYLLSEMGVNL
ncbi:MAG: S46 family peptidase [Bacteroidetes bacterium]|nr:S46 family peptidase [Bacteroidota bacterium]